MRILALGGAGAVCQEATKDLAEFSDFEEIVVADYNLTAVKKLIAEIGDPRLTALKFDAENYDEMLKLFPQFDVVMNGLPFKYDLAVNTACVETGVNGLDLSSEDPQFALHEKALAKDMIFVPGVGATPGITNMCVRRATEQLDEITEVEIFFAAFRNLAPGPGLLATTLWEFVPGEGDREDVYFEDGRWRATPPLSGGIDVRFHDQIGTQRVYYVPHDEAQTLPRSYPSLRRAAVRGCFPPHVMSLMGSLMKGGFLVADPIKIGDTELPAVEYVRELLWNNPISKTNPVWAYGLVIEVTGTRNGRHAKCVYRTEHPPQDVWGGKAAYFKNVGIPLSIGAQMLAKGMALKKGVQPPELTFPTAPFFEALEKRGIKVHETITEDGYVL